VFATLVQMQALLAVRNSGFAVPAAVLDRACGYLEKEVDPSTPSGAAAVPIVFGTGHFEAPLAAEVVEGRARPGCCRRR